MIIYLSVLVAIIGLLMYALAANPKLQEIGRLSFFAGVLAFLIRVSAEALKIVSVLVLLVAAGGVCRPAQAQTKAAESTAAPVVFVYAPGYGIVGAVLGPSITVNCTTAGVCTIGAVVPAAAPVPVPVGCEGYAATGAQTVFPLKFTPAGSVPLMAVKNGLLLMNVGGLDWSLAGSTVTLTAIQAAAAGDQVCFIYSH